jgi:cytochrome c oxidase accessory protein FixG
MEHPAGFIGLMAFTGVFYWVFAWFREQACVAVCPYGRLQGVLLDKNSLVVAYDWLRGEPRGKIKKNQTTADTGDCIDCKLCVHVCPTGIDIRTGTQLECVNCTACIDACDEVMLKVNKPTGLIRFASYNSIKDGIGKLINLRVIGYSVVLVALLSLLGYFIGSRSDIETTILKVPGTLYQRTDDGHITNMYNIQFVNKTFEGKQLDLKLRDAGYATLSQVGAKGIFVKANAIYEGVFFIKVPLKEVKSAKTTLMLEVYAEGELVGVEKTKFLGPVGTP